MDRSSTLNVKSRMTATGGGKKNRGSEGVVSHEVVKDLKQEWWGSIFKRKHERPLYLELLKIMHQRVAGASCSCAPLSFQASGIDRQGAV